MTINHLVDINKKVRPRKSKYYSMDNKVLNAALNFYDITDDDIDKGLRYIKQLTKHKSRGYAIQFHPDTSTSKRPPTGLSLNRALRYNRLIQSLEWVPMTPQNCNRLLEAQKGYQ